MIKVRYKVHDLDDNYIHAFPEGNGREYTLCGSAGEGIAGQHSPPQEFVESSEKVDCPDCLQLIIECKNFKLD